MIRGAIFDLDGTLLDSMSVWDGVGEEFLRSVGCEPEANLSAALKEFSLRRSAEYFREKYGVSLSVDEIIDAINAIVANFYANEVLLKPGAAELIKALSEMGVRMAVATETDEEPARAALRRCGIEGYFCGLLSTRAGTERGGNGRIGNGQVRSGRTRNGRIRSGCADGKRSPEIYERALAVLGTDKSETLVFEDALYALKTAHEAGFPTAAVFDPHEPEQEKLRAYCDLYIESMENSDDILKFFPNAKYSLRRREG